MLKIQSKARWKVKAFNDAQLECWQNYCEFSFHLTLFSLSYLTLIYLQNYWCSLGSLALIRYTPPGWVFWYCWISFFEFSLKIEGRRAEETCNWMKNSWFSLSCWSQQMVLTAFAHFLEKPYIIRQLVYGIYQGTAIRLTATCHFSERWRIGFWKQNTSHNVESFRISTPYDFGCFHELFSQNDALLLSQ